MKSGQQLVLFDGKSTSVVSGFFTVQPKHGVALSLFGVPCDGGETIIDGCEVTDNNFYIEKVLFASGVFPNESDCRHEGINGSNPAITASEYVAQCGLWGLDQGNNYGIITTPGTYRVIMENESLLGSVSLFAIGLGGDDLQHIPDDLFFGKISGDCA